MLTAVSRAPLAKLQAYQQRMGWTFPWASSFGSDFNFDFSVSLTEQQQRAGGFEYNYRARRPRDGRDTGAGARRRVGAMTGTDAATYLRERPGVSAFVLEDGVVYHTYSTLCARRGRPVGDVPVARPRPQGRNEAASGCAAMTNTARLEDSPMTEPFVVRRETYIAAPPQPSSPS